MFLVVLHGQKEYGSKIVYNRLYEQLYPRFAALVLYSKKYTEPWYCIGSMQFLTRLLVYSMSTE
jgi:hypothetical protein